MTIKAYTLGNPESYEKALTDDPSVNKLGRTEDYPGGCVYRTAEAATNSDMAKEHGYKAYGLVLPNGWEQDVDETNEEADGHCSLLNDAQIVRVVDYEG